MIILILRKFFEENIYEAFKKFSEIENIDEIIEKELGKECVEFFKSFLEFITKLLKVSFSEDFYIAEEKRELKLKEIELSMKNYLIKDQRQILICLKKILERYEIWLEPESHNRVYEKSLKYLKDKYGDELAEFIRKMVENPKKRFSCLLYFHGFIEKHWKKISSPDINIYYKHIKQAETFSEKARIFLDFIQKYYKIVLFDVLLCLINLYNIAKKYEKEPLRKIINKIIRDLNLEEIKDIDDAIHKYKEVLRDQEYGKIFEKILDEKFLNMLIDMRNAVAHPDPEKLKININRKVIRIRRKRDRYWEITEEDMYKILAKLINIHEIIFILYVIINEKFLVKHNAFIKRMITGWIKEIEKELERIKVEKREGKIKSYNK